MGRQAGSLVRILLLTAMPFAAVAGEAPAESGDEGDVADFEQLDLERLLDVTFSASRHEQDILDSPSAVTVITQEQIENTFCTDVACLLGQVPEMDVLVLRPMYTVVGARALTDEVGNKVLVLVDGQEINTEGMGFPVWQALNIHLEDIERIEIVRGPGSALYGANAHSGVVSITTRRTGDSLAEAFLGAAGNDRTDLQLRLHQRFGDWTLGLSGGGDTSGGLQAVRRRERETGRLRLRVDRDSDSSLTTLQVGATTAQGWLFSLFGAGEIQDVLILDLSLFHQRESFQARTWYCANSGTIPVGTSLTFNDFSLGRLADQVTFATHTWDTEAQVNLAPFAGNLLLVGAEARWIRFLSDQAEPGSVDQIRLGLFVHDEQRLGQSLIVTGGVRFDYNSITPFSFSPRLAGVWKLDARQSIRLAFGQAFRKPNFFNTSFHLKEVEPEPGFDELKDFFLRNIGNEELQNESITAIEAGYAAKFLDSRLSLEADAFYNRYRNTINFRVNIATRSQGLPDLVNSEARFSNQGREVDSLGGSIALSVRVVQSFLIGANYTLRHSFYIADAVSSREPGHKGDRVSWEPAHRFNLFGHYLHPSGLRLGLGLQGKSETDWVVIEEGIFGEAYHLHTPASWYWSGFLAYRFPAGGGWAEVGVRAVNFLGNPYRDMAGMVASDGDFLGGDPLGRQVLLFLRATL